MIFCYNVFESSYCSGVVNKARTLTLTLVLTTTGCSTIQRPEPGLDRISFDFTVGKSDPEAFLTNDSDSPTFPYSFLASLHQHSH